MHSYLMLSLGQADAPPPPTVAPPTSPTTTAPANESAPLPSAGAGSEGLGPIWMMLLVFVVFYLVLILPQRKEKKKHQQLVANLKKGDKVVTAGGVLGTVVEAKGEEVVLKVDESNNTRMRFRTSSVQSVLEAKGD